MAYVDGFVIPMPKKSLAAYKKMAKAAGKVWMKLGALEYVEAIGEDLRVHKGMGMGFKKLTKLKPNEVVAFSFIVYKSRKHRDEVNKAVMKDPVMLKMMKAMEKMGKNGMPFDMKRFAMGGFETIVDMS